MVVTYIGHGEFVKAIAIFSIKGGVGKSAIAVNLAYASALSSARRTLLWDLDSQGASTYLLNANPPNGVKARAAVAGQVPIADLIQPTAYPNLDILPADRSLRRIEGDLAQSDQHKQLKNFLKELAPQYDRIILDCPPGLSELAERVFRAVDLAVLPLIPSPLSTRAADQLEAYILKHFGTKLPIFPVWSMVDKRRKLHRETVAQQPEWPQISYSASVESMSVHQKPVALVQPHGLSARAFSNLWTQIENQTLRRREKKKR